MKKLLNKTLCLLMIVVMCFIGASLTGLTELGLSEIGIFTVQAANSGKCGTNLTWNLSNGTLTISGTGAMTNYPYGAASPWYNNSSVKKIIIEDGVTTIGDHAFYSCRDLAEIIIPKTVTSIGEFSFVWCTSLTEITIPDGVVSVGEVAFQSCKALETVTIGSGLRTLGGNDATLFLYCEKLKKFDVDNNNIYFSSEDGVLFNKNKTKILFYPVADDRTSYDIPNSVTHIGCNAFNDAKNLKNISIPNGVTIIDDDAFFGCEGISNVHIPSSVQYIEPWAFYACYSLNNVIIPASVKEIGGMAFEACSNLRKITILNPDCVLFDGKTDVYDGSATITSKATIYGYINSTAHTYANKYGRKFVSFENPGEIFPNPVSIVGRTFDTKLDYYTTYWSSASYNAHLANMLAALSAAVYSESDITNAYYSLGFGGCALYDYDGDFNSASCGYSIGFKESEYSNDVICLISVRGSSNVSDWVGNIGLATFEDQKHIGFAYPANRIYEKIKFYETNMTSNVKYVITGHSRGAAVANLLSVKLMENGVSSSNIYNYNLACPDVGCKYSFTKYSNIFNLCNRLDIVPFVPGDLASLLTTPGTSWGKFGQTYWFTMGSYNPIDMFDNHNIWLYLDFFDKKLNPSDWGESPFDKVSDSFDSITGWITKILCPVDVVVTDVEGNKIASVIDGKVNYYDSIFGDVIILTDGDKKVIYVNGDRNFNVNLVGTDDGTMTYSVEKYNLINDNSEEIKSFVNIELQKGKEMYSPVSTAEKTEDIKLFVIEEQNGKEITSYEINADGSETELNHVYKSVINAPTCTGIGFTTYTCSCGDTYTGDTVPANGHTDSEWIVDSDSTCVKEGSKHIECTVCEEVLKTEPIAKLPHSYSSVVTEATCETGGYTTYTCTCGDTYTGDKTPAKGHDYAEGVCKNCGDSKIDNCSCNCHKSGLSGLIWKIIRFFYKLFKINPVCGCGVSHY